MKIKLVTLYDEKFNAIGDISSRVMAEYCNKRGYEFTCYRHLPDKSRGAQWNKIRAVMQELPTCDWVVWMDADSIPVNSDFSIEMMIGKVPDKDLIISGDRGGLCFGIFAIRNCAWSVQFLQTLWYCGQMDGEYGKRYQPVVKFDQVSVKALIENFPSIANRVFVLPQNFVCNPHSEFLSSRFAMHYWATGWSENGNDLGAIARKMDWFISNGWSPSAHRDLKIVTCCNSNMLPILKTSKSQNEAIGYEVCVYDINGEIGFGTRFESDFNFKKSLERDTGKLPFKPKLVRKALQDHQQFITYMDADAFAIRRFDEVNTGDYDVGVTMRRPEERGATYWPSLYGFLNAGVLFFNHTPGAFRFIDLWDRELENSKANSDQEALNMVVLQATDLIEYDKIFVWNGIRIKVFRCDYYNFYYWPQEPLSGTKIVHCKTDKRMAMEDWGTRKWNLD